MTTSFFQTELGHSVTNVREEIIFSPEERFAFDLTKIIHSRIADRQFGTRNLASAMHLSISQLNRKLKASSLPPAAAFIRETKLRFAAQLLKRRNKSIGAIAFQAGFCSQAHFSRCFKLYYNMTPGAFMRQSRTMSL